MRSPSSATSPGTGWLASLSSSLTARSSSSTTALSTSFSSNPPADVPAALPVIAHGALRASVSKMIYKYVVCVVGTNTNFVTEFLTYFMFDIYYFYFSIFVAACRHRAGPLRAASCREVPRVDDGSVVARDDSERTAHA